MKILFLVIGLILSLNSYADRNDWRGGMSDRGNRGAYNNSGDRRDYRDNRNYGRQGGQDWGHRFQHEQRHHYQPQPMRYPAYNRPLPNNCQFNPYNGMTFCPPPPRHFHPPQFNFVAPFPRW